MRIRLLVGLVFAGIAAIFCLQNVSPITVSFLMTAFELPVWSLMLIFLGFGAIIARGLFAIKQVDYLKKIRKRNLEIADLRKEIEKLEDKKYRKNLNMRKDSKSKKISISSTPSYLSSNKKGVEVDINEYIDLLLAKENNANINNTSESSLSNKISIRANDNYDIPSLNSTNEIHNMSKINLSKGFKVNDKVDYKNLDLTQQIKNQPKFAFSNDIPAEQSESSLMPKDDKLQIEENNHLKTNTAVKRFSLKDSYKKHMEDELKNIENLIKESEYLQSINFASNQKPEEIKKVNIAQEENKETIENTIETIIQGKAEDTIISEEISTIKSDVLSENKQDTKPYNDEVEQEFEQKNEPAQKESIIRDKFKTALNSKDFKKRRKITGKDIQAENSNLDNPKPEEDSICKNIPYNTLAEPSGDCPISRKGPSKRLQAIELGIADMEIAEKHLNNAEEPKNDDYFRENKSLFKTFNTGTIKSILNKNSLEEINNNKMSKDGFVKIENHFETSRTARINDNGKSPLGRKVELTNEVLQESVDRAMMFDKTAYTCRLLSRESINEKFNWTSKGAKYTCNEREEGVLPQKEEKRGFFASLFSVD